MTTDYTPTTEQVRDGYRYDSEAEYLDPITPHHIVNGYAFDRWLAIHDAEVRAAALAERDYGRTTCVHGKPYFCTDCDAERVRAIRADEREKAAERIAKGVRHAYDCPGLDDWNACDCGMKLMYDLAAARGDGAE